MASKKDGVIIFKALSEGCATNQDPYYVEVSKLDIHCCLIPVIHFNFINHEQLREALSNPEHYSGIIFGSPRCVEALAEYSGLDSQWYSKEFYAVGERTSQIAREKLKVEVQGGHTGTGKALGKHILESNRQRDRPFLIPCGNLGTHDIMNTLEEGGCQSKEIIVYETVPHPDLEKMVLEALLTMELKYILYFSPSGVSSTIPLLKTNGVDLSNVKLLAIGPTTKTALLKDGLNVAAVADKPTPEGFVAALSSVMER